MIQTMPPTSPGKDAFHNVPDLFSPITPGKDAFLFVPDESPIKNQNSKFKNRMLPHSIIPLPILAAVLLAGCYAPKTYPLQPGEKIIFNTRARAAEYRQLSGNDPYHTNRVLEITRPCAVTAE